VREKKDVIYGIYSVFCSLFMLRNED